VSDVLDVSALRVLQAIASHGTLTRAAEALGTSQPAVSQHVKRMERRLGTALLVRSGRTVRLTEAGQVLARHGETVGAAVRAASAQVAALTGLKAGLVRVVTFPSSSATLLPVALAALRRDHPGLRVSFDELEPPESVNRLRAGECDLALAFSYPGTPPDALDGLVVRHLLDDPTFAVLPEGHPAAAVPDLGLEQLADETWIAGCPRCRGQLLASCQEHGFEPEIAYATDDYVAVLGLVAAGLGVAQLPGLVRRLAARTPGVVLRDVGTAPRRIVAVTTHDLLRVPAVAATMDALAAAASQAA
jgi:DNA-binding transcriptional LysR family regulator